MQRNNLVRVMVLSVIISTSICFGISAYGIRQNATEENNTRYWQNQIPFSVQDIGKVFSNY